MAMKVSEIKAELAQRKIKADGIFEKEELAQLLLASRSSVDAPTETEDVDSGTKRCVAATSRISCTGTTRPASTLLHAGSPRRR